jgi:selenocysteine lyase/cysteine desulfurase
MIHGPEADARLSRWRADTPACEHRIHLNNAGAALMPTVVRDAIVQHLDLEVKAGGYEAADVAATDIAAAYAAVAQFVGGQARNVAIVESATVAFAQALSAIDFEPGDRIVTTRADYVSNQLMYLSLAQRRGVEVVRAEDLPEGGVDPASVAALLRQRRPRLVALTWVPTNSGLVQDAEAVGVLCETAGVPYLVDACQAIGQMPVDATRLRCDYLAATARKFLRGPRGIGFLYVADRALEGGAHPLHLDMRGATWTDPDRFRLAPDARRFETWEFAWALVLGLGAATRYAIDVGLETARERAWALAAYARERLAGVPGVRLTDRGATLSAIVTAHLPGRDAGEVKLALRKRGINTSASPRDNAVIDLDAKGAPAVLRISPHYYNTTDEIDRAVEALAETLSA